MLELNWKIKPNHTPRIAKKCPRCNHPFFVCSEKFRMNSNKKSTDIWLIYRCEECNYTWNMNIVTRKETSKIDKNLFAGAEKNDVELAWKYAFDKDVMTRNKIQVEKLVSLDIGGDTQELFMNTEKFCRIHFHVDYYIDLPVKKILQNKFKISHSVLDRLYEEKAITIVSSTSSSGLATKIGKSCVVELDLFKLKQSAFVV